MISLVVIAPKSSVSAHPIQAMAAFGVGRDHRRLKSFQDIRELTFEQVQFGNLLADGV
jgi:hypothetical protein